MGDQGVGQGLSTVWMDDPPLEWETNEFVAFRHVTSHKPSTRRIIHPNRTETLTESIQVTVWQGTGETSTISGVRPGDEPGPCLGPYCRQGGYKVFPLERTSQVPPPGPLEVPSPLHSPPQGPRHPSPFLHFVLTLSDANFGRRATPTLAPIRLLRCPPTW